MYKTFKTYLSDFRRETDGAVTVDWVVLTAAIVGLAIAVLASVASGASGRADRTALCFTHIGNWFDSDDYADALDRMLNKRYCNL